MWLQLLLAAIVIYILWQHLKKPDNYPPGYWGVPVLGSVTPLFSSKTVEEHFSDLKELNHKIAGWRIGSQYMVLLFDYKLIKEAFADTEITYRPQLRFLSVLFNEGKDLGIIPTSGIHWSNSRRFAMHQLRDLGMGKSRLVSAVQYEANDLVNVMKKQAGKPAKLPYSITTAVLNVIWKLVADKRYELDDPEIERFERLVRNLVLNIVRIALRDFFPWLSYILPHFLLMKLTREEVLKDLSTNLRKFIEDSIKVHEMNLDSKNSTDLIDAYLLEVEKHKDDPDSTLSREDLIYCVADLFAAGSETTTSTLQWAIFYMAFYPEVQKRLQKEIDEVIPKGTSATLEDKPKLPYLDAFIHEVLRHSALVQTGVMHMATREKQLGGFTIPKGTIVLGITSGPHRDPKYFKTPEEFRPERFIDSNGKFANPREGFLPFSTGRRQCLGESLSRMELFVFLTTFIQNLHFDHPPGGRISLTPMESASVLRVPDKDQNILITCR